MLCLVEWLFEVLYCEVYNVVVITAWPCGSDVQQHSSGSVYVGCRMAFLTKGSQHCSAQRYTKHGTITVHYNTGIAQCHCHVHLCCQARMSDVTNLATHQSVMCKMQRRVFKPDSHVCCCLYCNSICWHTGGAASAKTLLSSTQHEGEDE